MEMRAKEDIPIGQDLTPPIPPLSLSLHHSTLLSHCSSCFSPLPPTYNHNPNHFIHYCSLHCSSLDSPLHFSSSEFHFFHLFPQPLYSSFPTATDLRLSLRLLHHFQESKGSFPNLERIGGSLTNSKKALFLEQQQYNDDQESNGVFPNLERNGGLLTNFKKVVMFLEQQQYNDDQESNGIFSNLERIGGLLTNFKKVMCLDDDEELCERILDGAKAMAISRRMRDGLSTNGELSAEEYIVEAAVICLVLTNAVEVHDKDGRSLGVGVYDVAFSYINHSCSPNASYRFCTALDSGGILESRICQAGAGGIESESIINGSEACGPRITLRSIKDIQKSEEVLITYTDLLQPKVMRQSELWSKYRFSCCCKRCRAMPMTYTDHCLQEILILNLDCSNMASGDNFYGDHVLEKLVDFLNDAIDDFLSFSNPKSCCEKLEVLLTQDHAHVVLKPNTENLRLLFRLYPLHHVSLHAYMTLASAYKVSESDLLALDPESDKHQTEAFSMIRKSAAYSLLLAGATHHLLESESSLIVPVSNFWTTAGETLLSLVRSSAWNLFSRGRDMGENSFSSCRICGKCALLDRFRDKFADGHDENPEFAEVTSKFLNCVTAITPKIWDFLVEDGGYLKVVEDPINFRWLGSRMSSFTHFATHATSPNADKTNSGLEAQDYHSEIRVNLFLLGIHCLIYGAFLSTICFGSHSALMSKVESLLCLPGFPNG
ncbi:protein SET DOMAIN GROUP 41-like isoform X2 [Lycium ferocissimum]|uniref:protein SET DOMAIN GROUP 41-like isoform X2 n=1 Tax=Lycium ferocissimum TaxID=112874 RepID=UPI002815FC0E|nr:protein SET DOMAIN GROUP 41-like isoform X2 [Lycium ferocissimum]